MGANTFTRESRRGLAILCAALMAWAAAGFAQSDENQKRQDAAKLLNKSAWVTGVWGIAGADTGNPGMDAMAREQMRKRREQLERLETSNPALQGQSLYERSQDLHHLEQTQGANPGTVHRTPPPLAVRWISAPSMLEALRQSKQPMDPGKSADLERLTAMARQFYVIAIGEGEFVATTAPVVIKQFDSAEFAGEVMGAAFLVLPDGRKIRPASVSLLSLGVFQPTPLFLFPRTVNGEPTIGSSVKNIVFHYDKLDVKFNLSKMTSANHKLEL